MGELSRDLLALYAENGNVELINVLLGTDDSGKFRLTPMNWKIAVHYFRAFIPHASNWEKVQDYVTKGSGKRIPFVFGKKSGNRAKKIGDALETWLAVDTNTIWNYAAEAGVSAPEVDFAKKLTNAVDAAIEKGGMDARAILSAITASDSLSLSDLLEAATSFTTEGE